MSADEILRDTSHSDLQSDESTEQTVEACSAGKSAYLSRHRDLLVILKPNWRLVAVRIVKDYRHRRFGNASLTALVNKVLQVLGADLESYVH